MKEINLKPLGSRVIVRVDKKPEPKTNSGIILAATEKAVEQSTTGTVVIPNSESYYRDGTRREPFLSHGDRIRFEKGNVGDQLPEAPEGETWYAIPEECIIMVIK